MVILAYGYKRVPFAIMGATSMKLEPIDVECYSGGRSDERPRQLKIRGTVLIVARLLSQSIEENAESKQRRHRYRVLTTEGHTLDLFRDHNDRWYLLG